MSRRRICVIGAGPAGMSVLHHFAKMEEMPDVVCFERQSTWGGQWNLSWKTGLDEHGEPVHTSTYKYMWCNVPKEAHEYWDYPFEKHFGQATPSFPSRVVLRDYLEGRFTRGAPRNLKDYIRFNTSVRLVKYSDGKDEFTVSVNDYNDGSTRDEVFSHVVVSTGIYHSPNLPEFPGMNTFRGRILHSHDFHDAREFKDRIVLIVGAGFSGEDAVLQCLKFGAKRVIFAYRTQPKSATCTLPDGVEEKPNVDRFDVDTAYFIDGSSAEIDCIILATGYKNYFPFLEDRFMIPEKTHLYPDGLYKGTLFFKAGKNKLFYIGALHQVHSFTYFEVMANWTCKYIMEQLPNEPKTKTEMEADCKMWIEKVNKCKSEYEVVDFQTSLIEHLADIAGYNKIVLKYKEIMHQCLDDRRGKSGMTRFKDRCYTSFHTGITAPQQTPFMENYDDSVETYLKWK